MRSGRARLPRGSRTRPRRASGAWRRPRRPPGDRDRRPRAPPAGRSGAGRGPRARERRARSAAGRRCRRGSLLLELEHLALDLDLVADLGACLAQRLLELLVRGGPAGDAEAAVGAQDAEAAPRVGLGPVRQVIGKPLLVVLARLLGGAEREEGPAEALDT